jgi:molecular chaperone DnaK
MPEQNEVLCRMRLDLDGILEVTAVEKLTGKSKRITIANALRAKSAEEIAAGRKRIQELYQSRNGGFDGDEDMVVDVKPEAADNVVSIETTASMHVPDAETENLLQRSRRLLDNMHPDDREEAIGLHEEISAAIESGDGGALREASKALEELLFFIEGKS